MKKKLLSLLLVTTMAVGMITGCGSGGGKKSASADDENTLTVWAWDQSFNIYAMKEAEKIYQKDHPDFKLNIVETSWDDMQTQLGTIVGAGDYSKLPDICLMQDFAYQKYVTTYPDLYQDITDSGIDFSQFAESKLAASTINGKNYGVPFDNGAEIACYRTDILKQAGYTLDDLTDIDWNKFIEIGKDVYAKTGYSLLSVQAESAGLVNQMLQSAGTYIWTDDEKPEIENNSDVKKCIEIYKELADTHVMNIVNSWDEYIATFTSGKTAGVINGCWIIASIKTAEDLSGKWGITNMPSLPDTPNATNYSNSGGATWAITSNCKNTKLAEDFLAKTFAGSKELYDTILPNSGALSTWLPASESDAYKEPQDFFGGQKIYEDITEYASKVPSVNLGVYFTEADAALATAIANVTGGADINSELKNAQKTLEFNMGN